MGSQTLSVKDQVVNIFSFLGHLASAAATQHCHCSVKAATDDTSTDGRDSVPIKLYSQEQAVAGFALWPQSPDS